MKYMNAIELKKAFFELQGQYKPFMDVLIEKQELYRKEYGFKGIEASPSPLIYQPNILFLGYNPAGGRDWWQLKKNLPLVPHLAEEEIMFFRENTARKGKWFELDKPVHNPFPCKIIHLLYELASLVYPGQRNGKGTNQKPHWAENMETSPMSMMYLNLYPIATSNGNALISLCKKLCQEKEIPAGCQKSEWEVRRYMIHIMHQMVKLLDPKVVVCMGAQTFHDYTCTSREKHSIHDILTTENYPKVIGFSRRGAWDGNIPRIAKEIYHRIMVNSEQTIKK